MEAQFAYGLNPKTMGRVYLSLRSGIRPPLYRDGLFLTLRINPKHYIFIFDNFYFWISANLLGEYSDLFYNTNPFTEQHGSSLMGSNLFFPFLVKEFQNRQIIMMNQRWINDELSSIIKLIK